MEQSSIVGTLSHKVEEGIRALYANILVTIVAMLLSFLLTNAFSWNYYRAILTTLVMMTLSVVLLFGLSRLNLSQTKISLALNPRIYVNLKEGLILPSPSVHYLVQEYAHALYRVLDKCGLADKNAIREPPDIIRLYRSQLDFTTELLEETLLRVLGHISHNCVSYHGGDIIDLDLADHVRPRLTATLREVGDKCQLEGLDRALLNIPIFLPKDFSFDVKRVGKLGNLFEITLKSKYCALKIRVTSYSWSSQVPLRIGPIPMLDRMPISSATIDYYFRLSKLDIKPLKEPLVIIPVSSGDVGVYSYHAIVEVKYDRLRALVNSRRAVSCLRYLECLTELLINHADWNHRATLDYNRIREEEVLSTVKQIERALNEVLKRNEAKNPRYSRQCKRNHSETNQ